MISGRYRDELVQTTGERYCRAWRSNQVVDRCYALFAGLMKGEEALDGVLFWAVGTGDPAWDAQLPQAKPNDLRLVQEVRRQSVYAESMAFLDDKGNRTENVTARLEVRAAFSGSLLGGATLREFGLFGGDATPVPNSGFMINRVVHKALTLRPGEFLERRVELSLGAPPPSMPPGPLGGVFGAKDIQGVRSTIRMAYERLGVTTALDLARLDPQQAVAGVTPHGHREIVQKARLVSRYRPPSYADPLRGRELLWLLANAPDVISASTDGAMMESEAAQLQDGLRVLELCLDQGRVEQLTLGDLIA